MKKILLLIGTVFLAYIAAFYTTGKKNGYDKAFDFDALIQKLDSLSSNNDAPGNNYTEKGIFYLGQEEYDDALEAFFNALDKDDNSENNYYVGYTYLMQEEYYSALDYLNYAIELDAKNDKAYLDKGITEYYQGYYDTAINDLFFATELNPEGAKAYYYLALCYEKNSKPEVALQSAETAIKYDSLYTEAWFKAGYIAFDLDSFKRARNYYLKLINIEPNHQYGLINLGLTYSYLEKNDSAIFYYDLCIENYPDYNLAYNNKGYIYQKQEQYRVAIPFYTKASQLDETDNRSVWNRGDCYFEIGEYNNAIKDFKRVYELDSDSYNALYQIGESYEKAGMKKEALDYYQQYQTVANPNSSHFDEASDKISKLN